MMTRRFIVSLLAGAALLVGLSLRAPANADEPASTFTAHEWGVWVVDEGRVAHLPALAAECPSFVVRAPEPTRRPIPRIRTSPVTVEKPVIFFHTDDVIENVRVRVRFRGGWPWLFFPQARVRGRGLEWRGRISPRDPTEGISRTIHQGRPHPWWDILRQVGGARFETRSGSREDFLFYDGEMPFRSGFTFSRAEGAWAPRRIGAESKVWIQDGRQVHAHEVAPRQTGSGGTTHPATTIISLLRAELLSRGLLAGEADSLLRTWNDDLAPAGSVGQAPQPRAIYFVDRAGYDHMLPLSISPRPDEIVRVGLVIEMLH